VGAICDARTQQRDGVCPRCAGSEILVIDDIIDQIGSRSIGLA
jgi:hypothetical protein